MGCNIELCYLLSSDNCSILLCVNRILKEYGWNLVKAEYCPDAPLYKTKLGAVEIRLGESADSMDDEKTIREISPHYSPLLFYYKSIGTDINRIIVQIEGTTQCWKELSMAVDRQILDEAEKTLCENFKAMLVRLFLEVADALKPYYGIAVIEANGVVDSPDLLSIRNEWELGEITWLSRECVSKLTEGDFPVSNCYMRIENRDGSVTYILKDGLFELGY